MKSVADLRLDKSPGRKYFPSPQSWEDQVLYFLLADRFSTGREKPENLYNPGRDYENALRDDESEKRWHRAGDAWNGGTLKGIAGKIGYLKELGVTAVWISPVFRQAAWQDTYHGYGIQNFLEIDPHLGTKKDLKDLVAEAHRNGIHIILDVILNHTGDVFAYQEEAPVFTGAEHPLRGFRNGRGEPVIPAEGYDPETLGPDDGVLPRELMNPGAFSRKGSIANWEAYPDYVQGDFFSLKNIHTGDGDGAAFRPSPALKALTACYQYWIAYADIDGFRLDTVKHLEPGATTYFVTGIHEYAKTLGKNNFYVIGEITGGFNFAIDTMRKTGIDAALGINAVQDVLENTAKGYADPTVFFNLFKNSELPGEDEYKWYRDNVVTMFDDHDMVVQRDAKSRFCADKAVEKLLLNALFLNLMSPGIPCVYYGTEQAFDGSGGSDKFVRETMFEGGFGAFRTEGRHFFDTRHPVFRGLKKMIALRKEHPTLTQGRLYQREIAYEGGGFELPRKVGEGRFTGLVAWSRIFSRDEMVLLVNCDLENARTARVGFDGELHGEGDVFRCVFSSVPGEGSFECPVTVEDGRAAVRVTVPAHGCTALKKK